MSDRHRPRFFSSVSSRLFTGLLVVAILSLACILTAILALRLTVDSHDRVADADLPYLSAASQLSQNANLIASAAHTLATARTEFLLRSERTRIEIKLNTLDGFLEEMRQHVEQASLSEPRARDLFDRVSERRDELVANIDELNAAVLTRIELQGRFLTGVSALQEALKEIGSAEFNTAGGRLDWALVAWRNRLSQLTSDAFSLPVLLNRELVEEARDRAKKTLDVMHVELRQLTGGSDGQLEQQWQTVRNLLLGEEGLFNTRLQLLATERRVASILSSGNFVSSRFVTAVSDLFFDVQESFDRTNRQMSGFVSRVSTTLLAVAGGMLALVLLLIVYVRRSVINRLTLLKDAIRGHFEGEKVDIPTKGNDELAQIGGALAYLVREISEREQRLIQARSEAEAANEAKSEFLAVVSHELRTPMYGVLAMARFLLEADIPEDQRELAASIVSSGETLLSLLNDILDFSKIEAGKLELSAEPFDLRYELDGVESLIGGSAERKELDFSVSVAPSVPNWLVGDSLRIRQILINLAGNAVKFTEKGHVQIKVFLGDPPTTDDAQGACALSFEVADTGVGIDEEKRKRLFQPFTQGDSSTAREYGGTGLGLSISQRLVERMGGAITVESKPGQGSTFRFSILLRLAPSDSIAELTRAHTERAAASEMYYDPPNREDARKAGCVVLIAEDNETNRKIVHRLMSRAGCVFDIVENGQEAWEAFLAKDYGLVLTDCRMPILDGFELAARIRESERPGRPRIPIIALTADALPQTRERCRAVGVDDTLTKPIDFADLDRAITHWLPGAGRLRSRAEGAQEAEGETILPDAQSDILDLTPLREAFGEIDDDALDFLDRFVRSAGAKVEAILSRIDEMNASDLDDITHSLKGECFSLGGMKFGYVLEEFEVELRGAVQMKDWRDAIIEEWETLAKAAQRLAADRSARYDPRREPLASSM